MNLSTVPARFVNDPGAPRWRLDVTVVVAVAGAAALAGVVAGGEWTHVGGLVAALLVAELLPVRLTDGTELPLSYALVLPLVVEAGWLTFTVAVAAVYLLGAVPRSTGRIRSRIVEAAGRTTAGVAGFVAYHGVEAAAGPGGTARVLGLAVAAGAVFAVELVRRHLHRRESFVAARGPAAAFAVASTGVLTAVAVGGAGGVGGMGLWGVVIFAVPLLAVRWAFARLHAIRRTYDQTIEVLSVVPEMSGRTLPGHSRRVADLAREMGRVLGLSRAAVADLERAALLHSLGHVALDDPELRKGPVRPSDVARATTAMLADAEGLSEPARLVALTVSGADPGADDLAPEDGTHADERLTVDLAAEQSADADERLAADILTVATAFEQAAGGDARRGHAALELAVRSAGGVDDARVVAALEQVVLRRSRPPVPA